MHIIYKVLGACLLAGVFAQNSVIARGSALGQNQNTSQNTINVEQSTAAAFSKKDALCRNITEKSNKYTVCEFNLDNDNIKLFHRGTDGEILGSFTALEADLQKNKLPLVFAMNAGMYDRDFKPLGLYVEKGKKLKKTNHKDGYGNFHLKPNGIFYILENGTAGVMETERYSKTSLKPGYATQSGPMLVIDGELHPKFMVNSTSLKRRNGVGVSDDGKTVWFAISNGKVNFHSFGSLFRDRLKTKQALFLDGTISKLYAKNLSRHDKGIPLGPMIGVVEATSKADVGASQ